MKAIYCSNFGYQTRESDLKRLFARYGNVVRIDMETGYSVVYFEDNNDAEKAIHGLNGHMPSGPEFNGCKLVVQWGKNDCGSRSHGSSGSNQIPNRTLYVANFDPDLTKCDDIKAHFEPYGKVLSVRMLSDYAFVDFETQENATKALECTHLSTLFDRLLCVGYALRRDDNDKGRCDGPPNSRAMSPDPARASPVRDIEVGGTKVLWCNYYVGWHYDDLGSNSILGINSEPFVEATKCSKILFQSTCKAKIPPSPLIGLGSHRNNVLDTIDQTADGDGNGDGSSSDDDRSDDDGGGDSGDDGGVEGIHNFVKVVTLESEEIVFTDRVACKLFGVNPDCRSHVITVLLQENDSEYGRLGNEFRVSVVGEGRFTYETIDGSPVLVERVWNYRIWDKVVPGEGPCRPSWREEVRRHVNVRKATIAVFGNHNGRVNVLFLVV